MAWLCSKNGLMSQNCSRLLCVCVCALCGGFSVLGGPASPQTEKRFKRMPDPQPSHTQTHCVTSHSSRVCFPPFLSAAFGPVGWRCCKQQQPPPAAAAAAFGAAASRRRLPPRCTSADCEPGYASTACRQRRLAQPAPPQRAEAVQRIAAFLGRRGDSTRS